MIGLAVEDQFEIGDTNSLVLSHDFFYLSTKGVQVGFGQWQWFVLLLLLFRVYYFEWKRMTLPVVNATGSSNVSILGGRAITAGTDTWSFPGNRTLWSRARIEEGV